LQDQVQQERLEQKGEINRYYQQNTSLKNKLKEFQDNEEELWNCIDYLQDQLEQKEQDYIE
jgi:CII-binding regulator of phage lambda lysogenization HflD